MLRSTLILKGNGAHLIRNIFLKKTKKINSRGLSVLNMHLRTFDLYQIWRLETL